MRSQRLVAGRPTSTKVLFLGQPFHGTFSLRLRRSIDANARPPCRPPDEIYRRRPSVSAPNQRNARGPSPDRLRPPPCPARKKSLWAILGSNPLSQPGRSG